MDDLANDRFCEYNEYSTGEGPQIGSRSGNACLLIAFACFDEILHHSLLFLGARSQNLGFIWCSNCPLTFELKMYTIKYTYSCLISCFGSEFCTMLKKEQVCSYPSA
mgnify:CR=1 FL=1